MRLGPLELGLSHCRSSSGLGCSASGDLSQPNVSQVGVYLC
ncbi:hypothetical protein ADILRU_1208 [Leifsonia rubra CMS 76R]|nr:hypothetical protein ADILRU_1208 [Leifsonia rubra CMS 76R]